MNTDIAPDIVATDTGDPEYRHLYWEFQRDVAVCGYRRNYAIGTRDHLPKCPECLTIQKTQETARFN